MCTSDFLIIKREHTSFEYLLIEFICLLNKTNQILIFFSFQNDLSVIYIEMKFLS